MSSVNEVANGGTSLEDGRLPSSTINLLPQAVLSGNFHTIENAAVRGTPGQIVWDSKAGNFLEVTHTKTEANFQGYYVAHPAKGHGVVPEAKAAWWMAEWPRQIDANLIAFSGSFRYVPQPDTAWKIEYRQEGRWVEHARGVGGWYDGGRYFWGGPGAASLRFDAIRVSLFSRDSSTPLVGIQLRGEEGLSWVVGRCPPIDAFIEPGRRIRRAGRPETFVALQRGSTHISSWNWDFGDGRTAEGAKVSHTYAEAGTYDVVLTFSDGSRTGVVRQRVDIGSPIDVRIVPLSGPVIVGQAMQFSTQIAAGSPTLYSWDFGDGSTAPGATVTKVYSQPGTYRVTVEGSDGRSSTSSAAIVRAHTPETVGVPQVFLDSDMGNEADDQHYFAYALFSEADVLGVSSVHAGWENEPAMYDEIHRVLDRAKQSGLPAARVPGTYRGANRPLVRARRPDETELCMTDASSAILAAARGASPANPVWLVPVGPMTNVASAILQARAEGVDLIGRVRIMWLGGGYDAADAGSWNGMRCSWSTYIVGQSGIETWIILEPVGVQLAVTMATESDLYPNNPLGEYLRGLMPRPDHAQYNRYRGLYDPTALAAIISQARGLNWYGEVQRVSVGAPDPYVRWIPDDEGCVRLIRRIDPDAMKEDMFHTLNGSPTPLRDRS